MQLTYEEKERFFAHYNAACALLPIKRLISLISEWDDEERKNMQEMIAAMDYEKMNGIVSTELNPKTATFIKRFIKLFSRPNIPEAYLALMEMKEGNSNEN